MILRFILVTVRVAALPSSRFCTDGRRPTWRGPPASAWQLPRRRPGRGLLQENPKSPKQGALKSTFNTNCGGGCCSAVGDLVAFGCAGTLHLKRGSTAGKSGHLFLFKRVCGVRWFLHFGSLGSVNLGLRLWGRLGAVKGDRVVTFCSLWRVALALDFGSKHIARSPLGRHVCLLRWSA